MTVPHSSRPATKLPFRPVRQHLAFTLVEIMVATLCLAILSGTVLMLFGSGSRSSLRGMLRLETTLEARKILKQVYADLKLACFPLPYNSFYNFDNLMFVTGAPPLNMYSFLSFPAAAPLSEVFRSPAQGVNYRETALISYRLEPASDDNSPLLRLIREETFKNKTSRKVLSERVNLFSIKPVMLQPYGRNQHYFLITLQLVDSLDAGELAQITAGQQPVSNRSQLVVADYFDLVYPEFFHAAWNQPAINPNWHTQIRLPGE